MYGAVIGDTVGSPYEFDMGEKRKDFNFWNPFVRFTDDTVMTVAVADALLSELAVKQYFTERNVKNAVTVKMRTWYRKYPYAGYGANFLSWLQTDAPRPYHSYGNGSAMRVSFAGWVEKTVTGTRTLARWTAEVTHNHPEGIKGAEAVAAAIFLARSHYSKEDIKKYVEENFGYDLSRTIDEIRSGYCHVESCQKTVPEAITAFLESDSFEDAVRTAISIGGDTDTIACITGSIAEAYYGIPAEIIRKIRHYLTPDILKVLENEYSFVGQDAPGTAFIMPWLHVKQAARKIREYISEKTEGVQE